MTLNRTVRSTRASPPLLEIEWMDPEPALVRRFLGMVEVDSGTLLLGDPTYCLPHAAHGKSGIDYQAVIDAPIETSLYLNGRPVLLLSNFGGDGSFPVIAELDEYGELVRVTIEFEEPDDARDDPGEVP